MNVAPKIVLFGDRQSNNIGFETESRGSNLRYLLVSQLTSDER